jgi:hypothetical protein
MEVFVLHSAPLMEKTFWEFHQAFDHRMFAWKKEVIFTWEWWLGIVLTIIPWVLWYIFRKKDSSDRLLYAGIFVGLISLTLDNIGIQLSAWDYLKPVTPAIPSYVPYDFALMPVSVMFIIQVFPNRNPWLIGLIFGFLTAFVGEPFFKWLKIYNPENWRHVYSLPFYIVIYFLAYKLAKGTKFNELS